MYERAHGRFMSDPNVKSMMMEMESESSSPKSPTRSKAGMLEGIADLVSKETVKGIRDIRDESSKEGIRVVIEVKKTQIHMLF